MRLRSNDPPQLSFRDTTIELKPFGLTAARTLAVTVAVLLGIIRGDRRTIQRRRLAAAGEGRMQALQRAGEAAGADAEKQPRTQRYSDGPSCGGYRPIPLLLVEPRRACPRAITRAGRFRRRRLAACPELWQWQWYWQDSNHR